MDILSALNSVVHTIEDNICEEIAVADIAKAVAMNEYELLNLFHSLTGITIKEYIRKRRLSLAAQELQQSNAKIIDVAVKYGYDNADSFRRAFVQQHDVPPSMVKNELQEINIFPPISFHIKVDGGNKMNIKIVDADEMTVYGISKPCFSNGAKRYELAHYMWAESCEHIPERICNGYDGIWYAVWSNNSYTIARDKSNCEYDNLEKTIIPKAKYAVFTTERGGYAGDELPKLHNEIFNSWLPSSEYEQAFDFELEVYHLDTDREKRRKNRYYEIWLPVVKKSSCAKCSDVIIRNAKLSDANSIAEICENSLGYKCSAKLVEDKISKLSADREQVFVADANGVTAGFIHIEKYDVLYCESGTNILGLAVSTAYQHKGIGRKLLEKAEDWAASNGAEFVRLNSGADRCDAHSFYRRLGFDNEKTQLRFMKNI